MLLTRPAGRGSGLALRLRALGAHVEKPPTIEFESRIDSPEVRAAICALSEFALLLFTSPTGVHFFHEALARHGSMEGVGAVIGAIGPGTATALREAGRTPAVIARDSREQGLAEAVLGQRIVGKVLVIRPQGAQWAHWWPACEMPGCM